MKAIHHHVKKHYKKALATSILAVPLLAFMNPAIIEDINPGNEHKVQISDLTAQVSSSREKIVSLEFDRLRLEDSANILLAIQDYYSTEGKLPESLAVLNAGKTENESLRLADPESNHPYFYKSEKTDFVFCVWLSDMIKGVNTLKCPDRVENISKAGTLTVTYNLAIDILAEPNIQSKAIAKLGSAAVLEFTDYSDSWYKIQTKDGKSGWIFSDYIKVIAEAR